MDYTCTMNYENNSKTRLLSMSAVIDEVSAEASKVPKETFVSI